MNIQLFKKLVVLKDEKTITEKKFYTFYLKLENGMQLRVLPNSYKDDKGVMHSNYKELVLIAKDELPF